ncbi:hypothetical protein BH10PSE1_BH10PSE1_14490 [soil metagenome]
MSKYEPLTRYLADIDTAEVPMTFAEIEAIIGVPLPASKQYPAWWSNNPANNVMTKAWLQAGFQTERVEPEKARLVFRRSTTADRPRAGVEEIGRPAFSGRSKGFLTRIRTEMAGTVTIAEGVDICAPTGEVWDAER